jgi:gliding motility-associated lipoprotein GldH
MDKKALKSLLFVTAILITCLACDQTRVYEQNTNISNNQWAIDTIPAFTFDITDVSHPYNIYYNIRNSVSYPYYNLYVTYYLSDEKGKMLSSRLQELTLMDPKTGKPLGDGVGDIFDHQILSNIQNYTFPKAGKYTFKVKQYMRVDPLPEIMSVGIRVERADATPSGK